MSGQPQACLDSGCPVAGKNHGFALPSGDFSGAKIVVLLETPATNEIIWPIRDLADGQRELERRRLRYPALEETFISRGAAVVGASGAVLFNWLLGPLGINRTDIGLVNTLHCYPGKRPDGVINYPTGDVRKKAEACCSTLWWEQLREWNPTVSVVCLHPAALSREISPLPVCLKSLEKAKHFSLQGERVLILMGGKASKAWLGYAENTTVWCGHFQVETDYTRQKREERRIAGMALKIGPKVKKPKKLTAKTALAMLLEGAYPMVQAPVIQLDGEHTTDICYHVDKVISDSVYSELLALIAPKEKKVKEEGK